MRSAKNKQQQQQQSAAESAAQQPVVKQPVVTAVEQSVVTTAEQSVVPAAQEPVVTTVDQSVVPAVEQPVVTAAQQPAAESEDQQLAAESEDQQLAAESEDQQPADESEDQQPADESEGQGSDELKGLVVVQGFQVQETQSSEGSMFTPSNVLSAFFTVACCLIGVGLYLYNKPHAAPEVAKNEVQEVNLDKLGYAEALHINALHDTYAEEIRAAELYANNYNQ